MYFQIKQALGEYRSQQVLHPSSKVQEKEETGNQQLYSLSTSLLTLTRHNR